MTVLHRGKYWPTYNPGRFWTAWVGNESLPPTALRWQTQNWGGLIGTGAPNGGSDLLPVYPAVGPFLRYEKQLFGVLGNTFYLRVDVSIAQATGLNYDVMDIFVHVDQGGVNQIVGPNRRWPAGFTFAATWYSPSQYQFAIDAVAFPINFLTINPVHWFASPPPPASSPY